MCQHRLRQQLFKLSLLVPGLCCCVEFNSSHESRRTFRDTMPLRWSRKSMPRIKKIAIFGAGGFAREIAWLIDEINWDYPQFEFLGYLPNDPSNLGKNDSRDHILGDINWLDGNQEVDALALGIGNPERKAKVVSEVESRFPGLEWPALIHPTVQFDRTTCRIERGVVLCAGCIATVNVVFEEFCMVNLLCTIAHEARIGKYAVINPTANLSGGVTLGDR